MSNNNKKKKQVRFHHQVRVRSIRHVNDYTDKQIRRLWWTDHQLHTIHQSALATVRHMQSQRQHIPIQRGLEIRMPKTLEYRKAFKAKARAAVLQAQAQVYYQQKDDDEVLIAQAYQVYAKPSQARACLMGLLDERAAMRIYGVTAVVAEQQQQWTAAARCRMGQVASQRATTRGLQNRLQVKQQQQQEEDTVVVKDTSENGQATKALEDNVLQRNSILNAAA